jgi:CheY-like chemotaxis protein
MTDRIEIVIADDEESPAWKAWKQVLPLFMNRDFTKVPIMHDSEAPELLDSKNIRIGIALCVESNPKEFWNHFVKLQRAGCRHFIRIVTNNEQPEPWDQLAPRWKRAMGKVCCSKMLNVAEVSSEVQKVANLLSAAPTDPGVMDLLRTLGHSKELIAVLPDFIHGGALDVTNIVLAPARMICNAECGHEEKKEAWEYWAKRNEKWIKDVRKSLDSSWCELPKRGEKNSLALELFETWSAIAPHFDSGTYPCRDSIAETNLLHDLDGMMALLTEIRLVGRGEPGTSSGENIGGETPPLTLDFASTGEPQAPYRVLVVDDHSSCWHEVIRLAAESARILLGHTISIDFSIDGKTLATDSKTELTQVFCNYDLVILDVYLPGDRGPNILRNLRRDVSWLPVVIWTSSSSAELAGEASYHNGYLFKKTSSVKEITDVFVRLLPIGNALRSNILPNPFFNHSIKKLEYRNLAVHFHEWCLKQLDSFHALDGEYFRYFTDHGGRHIVKLFELMQKALQGFLGDRADNLLLPADPKEREAEILGIYLAIICHELGMFPMRIGGQKGTVEDFATLGRAYLDDVRALHAARGMVLIEDATPTNEGKGMGAYWNDLRGQELGKMLHEQKLAARVAVLVGYHARLFKSLKTGDFLQWKSAGADLREKINNLGSSTVLLCRGDGAFRFTFRRLARDFGARSTTQKPMSVNVDEKTERLQKSRERLRRQCALFRFVDALDITASRNPADFLIGSNSLRPQQYGENLKRELCEDAGIENGKVFARMRASAPRLDVVNEVFTYVADAKLLKGEEGKAAFQIIKSTVDEIRVKTPWGSNEQRSPRLTDKEAVGMSKALDAWLAEVWKVLVLKDGETNFLKHLEQIGVLDRRSHRPRLKFSGAKILASLTALSVAAELLDEYAAIDQAGLSDKISLPEASDDERHGFKWGEWDDVPDALITLLKVLPSNERSQAQSDELRKG